MLSHSFHLLTHEVRQLEFCEFYEQMVPQWSLAGSGILIKGSGVGLWILKVSEVA